MAKKPGWFFSPKFLLFSPSKLFKPEHSSASFALTESVPSNSVRYGTYDPTNPERSCRSRNCASKNVHYFFQHGNIFLHSWRKIGSSNRIFFFHGGKTNSPLMDKTIALMELKWVIMEKNSRFLWDQSITLIAERHTWWRSSPSVSIPVLALWLSHDRGVQG